jgi:hypothetical protein
MAEIVFEMIALVFQRIERLIFDAPARPCPPHELIHGAFVDAQICHPTEMLDFAFGSRLPALDEIDPQLLIGGIERHVTDKTKSMVNFGFVIFTILISRSTSSLGLRHWLEQKRMIPFFDPQHVMHGVRLQRFNMGGIRTQAVFGDNHLEMGVILTKLGDEALGRVALAIIFLRAIVLDNRFGHQRYNFTLIRVDEGRPQELMGIGHGAISVVFFQTRVAVNRFGGKIASAIKS